MTVPTTRVRLPLPAGAAGALGPARATIRLVGADGKPVMAFAGADLRTEYVDLVLTADRIVDLVPQSALARAGAAATWYDIRITTRGLTDAYRVQVPASALVLELADLVGAAALSATALTEGRTLTAAERVLLDQVELPTLLRRITAQSVALAVALG